MTPKTFIFIGRSGCGKGTQVKLLQEYLAKNDSSKKPVFYLETGAQFRDFIKGQSLTSKLSNEIYKTGARQPDFLAIWIWSHLLVENLTGDEHLIIDGTPRSLDEAKVLHTAIRFYKRAKPYVIYLDVSREWSEQKLLGRGRFDDDKAEVKKRLDWYEADVAPAVEYFRKDPEVIFLDIKGGRTIQEVHQDIISAIA